MTEPNILNMSRDEIVDMLKTNVCRVTFTKVNREERSMPCTLREDMLPPAEIKESTKKPNENVVSVWVTDIDQWRSFRVDSLLGIEVLEEEET